MIDTPFILLQKELRNNYSYLLPQTSRNMVQPTIPDMFFGLVRPVLLSQSNIINTCSAAGTIQKEIDFIIHVRGEIGMYSLTGRVASPGTRPVPLWYFSNVASYKATRDFINNAQFFVNRVLFPEISSHHILGGEIELIDTKRVNAERRDYATGEQISLSKQTDYPAILRL